MLLNNDAHSPSRTYVAMCYSSDFSNVKFKKFDLPEEYTNTCRMASWYFLNRLDAVSCIEGCIPVENYENLTTALE